MKRVIILFIVFLLIGLRGGGVRAAAPPAPPGPLEIPMVSAIDHDKESITLEIWIGAQDTSYWVQSCASVERGGQSYTLPKIAIVPPGWWPDVYFRYVPRKNMIDTYILAGPVTTSPPPCRLTRLTTDATYFDFSNVKQPQPDKVGMICLVP